MAPFIVQARLLQADHAVLSQRVTLIARQHQQQFLAQFAFGQILQQHVHASVKVSHRAGISPLQSEERLVVLRVDALG